MMRRWVFLVVGAAVVCSCGPNKPPLVALFPRAVTVYVAISEEVAKSDSPAVAAMVDALEADLRKEGRELNIVTARFDERPPLPRLELQVVSSRSANKQLQGFGRTAQLLAPAVAPIGVAGAVITAATGGELVVEAYVVGGDGKHPRYLGHYTGGSIGSLSDADAAAGEDVGHALAESLFE